MSHQKKLTLACAIVLGLAWPFIRPSKGPPLFEATIAGAPLEELVVHLVFALALWVLTWRTLDAKSR